MTTHDSVLNAVLLKVCDQPADDVQRLVAADYFEENGDPVRADFIRVQIQRRDEYPDHFSPFFWNTGIPQRALEAYPSTGRGSRKDKWWQRAAQAWGWHGKFSKVSRGWPTVVRWRSWINWVDNKSRRQVGFIPVTAGAFSRDWGNRPRMHEPNGMQTGTYTWVSESHVRGQSMRKHHWAWQVPWSVMVEMYRLRGLPAPDVREIDVESEFDRYDASIACRDLAALNVLRSQHGLPPIPPRPGGYS